MISERRGTEKTLPESFIQLLRTSSHLKLQCPWLCISPLSFHSTADLVMQQVRSSFCSGQRKFSNSSKTHKKKIYFQQVHINCHFRSWIMLILSALENQLIKFRWMPKYAEERAVEVRIIQVFFKRGLTDLLHTCTIVLQLAVHLLHLCCQLMNALCAWKLVIFLQLHHLVSQKIWSNKSQAAYFPGWNEL